MQFSWVQTNLNMYSVEKVFEKKNSKEHGELNKLPSLPMCGFIAQLVEQRTGNAEVTVRIPLKPWIFFFFSSFFFPIA